MALKRTWVVSLSQEDREGTSHSHWFGPYTREQAEALTLKLNTLIGDLELVALGLRPVAVAMPLMTLTPREVLAQFDKEYLE
jgi:hypothetical protein